MYEIPYHIRIGSFQTGIQMIHQFFHRKSCPCPEHPLTGPRQQHGDRRHNDYQNSKDANRYFFSFSLFYTFTIFAHFYTPYPVFYGIV